VKHVVTTATIKCETTEQLALWVGPHPWEEARNTRQHENSCQRLLHTVAFLHHYVATIHVLAIIYTCYQKGCSAAYLFVCTVLLPLCRSVVVVFSMLVSMTVFLHKRPASRTMLTRTHSFVNTCSPNINRPRPRSSASVSPNNPVIL
jgi:hypothetical protein